MDIRTAIYLTLLVITIAMTGETSAADSRPITVTTETTAAADAQEVVAVLPAFFPPRYQIDQYGQPYGFAIEVFQAVAERAGLHVRYRIEPDWASVTHSMQTGTADLIPNEGISDPRKAYLAFTKPLETTRISLFVDREHTRITGLDDIAGKTIGVLKDNIAEQLIRSYPQVQQQRFTSLEQALDALLTGRIDGLIYPEDVIWQTARRLWLDHRLTMIGPPLREIDRAIAVDKDNPALLQRLDTALEAYMQTDEFAAVYRRWHGQPQSFWDKTWNIWVMIGALDMVLLIMATAALGWRQTYVSGRPRTTDPVAASEAGSLTQDYGWVLLLILIMLTLLFAVSGVTLGLLYNTAFTEKQQGLLHTAQAKRHVIESLLADIPARQQQTALQNLLRSYSDDHGDHNHEDILLVKNGAIQNVFLLDRPYRDLPRERPIPAGSALAEPVQLALTGHSGTLIKSDSWGSRALLVAYEPLPSLSMGLVMTMDMATIRRPFLQAGLIAAAIILLAAGLGSGLFVWATQPYVRSLRDSHSRFYRAVREAPFPTIIHAEDGNILHVNRVWSEITGYRRADIPTIDAWTERAYGQRSAAVKAEIDQLFDLQQRREDGEFTITTRAGMNVVWRFGSAPLGRLADGRSIMISSAVDVTSQRRIEQDLRDSEQRFRQLAENIDVVFYLRDIATAKMLYLSPAYEKIWGRSCAECYKNPFAYVEGVHPEDRPLVRAAIEEHNRGQATRLEYRLLRPDGAICHVLARSFPIKDNAGNIYRLAGIVEDITPLKTAGRAMQWAKIVFDSTLDGIMITDSEAKIIAINQAFSDITGYSEQQVLGRNANIVQSRRHNRTFYNTLWADLTSSGKWQGEIWNRRRNGEVFPAWLTISAVHDPTSGRLLSYVGTFSDISELKRSEEKIQYLAHHDALTGLPNRLLFHARLVHAMERARRNHQLVAVLFLDLDNFKNVNDSLGHPVGDALLKQVAERLRMSLRREDTVARLGGDEFVIALEELPDMEAVENMVNKIIATFADAFELDGRQTFVSTSIGVSTYPADGEDVTTLMKNADTALYRVKKESRNNYRIYSDDMSREATERLALELALRESIYEKTGFTLLYQPQIDLASGRIDGFEALLRWRHPQMGLVAPDRFIPLAEDTGLIEPISEWVLYSACRQLHSWHKAGFDELKVSVNLSGRDVSRREIARRVRQILSETGLRPDRLVLEITESSIMEKPEVAAAVLNDLTQLNVRFAVDDFGTGYSSLAYLKRFPLHTLKIDKVFVRDAPDDFNDTAICRAIIALAQSLNMNVVAEGIETEAQRLFLNQAGCELGQGYLFSHPLAAEAVGAYLKNTRAIDAAEMIVEPQTAAARNAS